MAGADPSGSFVGDAFRNAILSAMTMGLPNTTSEQPTFQWDPEPKYAASDPAGNPWDWTATPTTSSPTPPSDLQVPCAVTYSLDQETGTAAGEINTEKITVILLDTQYNQLITHGGSNPDRIVVKGTTYTFDFMTLEALFDVDVYTMHASSVDA